MLSALLWGAVAASSFVVGGALALWRPPRPSWTAVGAGVGAGALLGAVSFELIVEAGQLAGREIVVAVSMLAGVALATTVMLGRGLRSAVAATRVEPPEIDHRFATLLLAVAAEAVIIVGALHSHGITVAVVVAVFLCGVPEAVVGTALLVEAGASGSRVMRTWFALVGYGGLSAVVADLLLDLGGPNVVAAVLSVAGGVVIANIVAHLVPTAFGRLGALSAFPVVLGFALSMSLIGVG
ncbi:hypothetical protein [Mumia zhuanghuii]|uniref:ZIP family metal transporter n=1 Tax=Mumia zhuanghuii TaxID=2585211 RepID=A0A5C4MVX6_9ACTN|nr:hypothetical protein [Mumia zhuanghuii]TNC41832.1 hypothetical protein FHE65_21800 [Mumia zhuanghuii]TNC48669.1 hypothetical protein FHE65_07150 [Mumia zhuanghuii]